MAHEKESYGFVVMSRLSIFLHRLNLAIIVN